MKYLLDTHVAVFRFQDGPQLSDHYHRLLDEEEARGDRVAISDISLWEIAMLASRGRLQFASPLDVWLRAVEAHPAIEVLPITARIAQDSIAFKSPFPRDPADRIIAATARCHGLQLMTLDGPIRESGAVAVV